MSTAWPRSDGMRHAHAGAGAGERPAWARPLPRRTSDGCGSRSRAAGQLVTVHRREPDPGRTARAARTARAHGPLLGAAGPDQPRWCQRFDAGRRDAVAVHGLEVADSARVLHSGDRHSGGPRHRYSTDKANKRPRRRGCGKDPAETVAAPTAAPSTGTGSLGKHSSRSRAAACKLSAVRARDKIGGGSAMCPRPDECRSH